jgi:GT2 family glycosyltransferase/SAM-dependent methyltransferase
MDELFREARYVLNSAGVWEKPGYQPLSYTDGVDVEERIAALLEQVSDRSVLSDELRPLCTDWPATYHLSHARANLLRPLERFLRSADVLEVGAGCGAITRYLGELGARVVALEGSPRRARAARSRARELANVSVVAEQFDAFRWPRAFDVVTLIGVFEYAGRFEPGPDPWVSMLARAREHLTDGGLLLLAIENQLGLKYLLGAAEDHLGVTGYGIESQYQPGEPRTFGWRRLSEVLTRAGFGARTVLLPLPDYKLPRSVLSEAGIADATLAAASLASQSVPHDRLFRHGGHAALERVWPTVAENGLMLELANSFLVVAANGGAVPSLDALAWHYSTDRRRAFCKATRFVRKGAAIEVETELLDPGARDPEGPLRFDPPKRGRYVCGAPLATKAVRLLTRPHWRVEELVAFFAEYRDCLTALIGQTGASVERGDVPGEWVDALPQNIVVAPDTGATLIDREWTMGGAIPFGFLVFRSILALSDSVTRVGESDDPQTRTLLGLVESVFDGLGLGASAETLGRYLELESQIQRQVKGVPGEVTLGDLAAAKLPVAPPADHRNCVPVATVNATLRGLAGESPALRGHISSSAYAISNPDVAAAGLDPVAHWLEQGYREGRVPTPALDALVDDLTAEAEAKAQASATLEAEVARLEQYLERRDAEARSLEQLLAARDQQLAAVYASTSWRVTKGIRVISRVARTVAPPYAPGGRVFRAARRLYRAAPLPLRVKHRGRHAWIARLFRYRTGTVAQPSTAPLTVDSPADGRREWISYAPFKARLVAHADGERARFSPAPPELRVIAEGDVRSAASRIQFPSAATPLVTIIVPVFGGAAMAVECLASLAHAKVRASFEVIVADDASPDGTADILAQVQGIRLRRNTINLGFIRNCNHAMADARGAYTLILNSDVQVSDGWLDALVEVFDTRPDAGAVGPKILYPSGHLQEAGVALRPDATSDMVGLNDDADRACYSYIRPVDYCSGAALMVRTATLRQLGGFDERLSPAYCEDADFCLRLRRHGLKTYYTPRAVVVHHLSRTMTSLSPEWKRWQIATNLATFTREWAGEIASLSHVRVLAFYLPQFHTIPENDAWWGAGFTEWTNVRRARPNFAGHYQPREPAELGYYDLNDPAAMDRQVALARRYGVDGFVYYYYWFGGRRLLEMPLERLLATGRPDYPYCLCWANENWSRRWDGRDQEILIGQSHTPEDDRAVIRDIARHFASARYIRIDGRPLVLVYRVELFPDFRATAARWRDVCRAEGHGEIYLAYVESHDLVHKGLDPSTFGCDAAVEFPPLNMAERTVPGGPILNPRFQGGVADYADTAFRFATRELPGYTRFRGVTPGWDNTPRRQDHGFVLHGSTPGVFQAWLEHVIAQTRAHRHGDERLVFVNAWNEWAEGAYLEPDRVFGHTYLEAVRNARDAERLLRLGGYELSA